MTFLCYLPGGNRSPLERNLCGASLARAGRRGSRRHRDAAVLRELPPPRGGAVLRGRPGAARAAGSRGRPRPGGVRTLAEEVAVLLRGRNPLLGSLPADISFRRPLESGDRSHESVAGPLTPQCCLARAGGR